MTNELTAIQTYAKTPATDLSCAIDFGSSTRPLTGQLDAGELLTGTPTVTQFSKTVDGADDITPSGVAVNSAATEINGRAVAIGEAVEVLIPGGTADCQYKFSARCETDAGRTLEGYFIVTVQES